MKKLLTLTVLMATLAITHVQAERAVIYGTLTIISNHVVVKMSEPFKTENDFSEGEIVSSTKVQIICTDEQAPELRALLGKKVQMDGEMFTAHTRYHIEPLLLNISEGECLERD